KRVEAAEARQRPVREARVSGTRPSLPLERYAGTYRHAMYGDVEVALEGGRLVARRGRHFVGDLEHWHYDTFRIDWRDGGMGESFITFELNARGEVAGAELQGVGRGRRAEARGRPGPGGRWRLGPPGRCAAGGIPVSGSSPPQSRRGRAGHDAEPVLRGSGDGVNPDVGSVLVLQRLRRTALCRAGPSGREDAAARRPLASR